MQEPKPLTAKTAKGPRSSLRKPVPSADNDRSDFSLRPSRQVFALFAATGFLSVACALGGGAFAADCGLKAGDGPPYAPIMNFPPRMICSRSTQMSKFRPTTSMCVEEYHFAPVCTPYGFQ